MKEIEKTSINMNKIIQVCLIGIMIPLVTGCATSIISHNLTEGRSDWFSPTALYKSNADGSLAVEGILVKAGNASGNLNYIIIPQDVLVATHLQTKGAVSFKDISSLPPKIREGLHIQKKLDLDLLKNDSSYNINPDQMENKYIQF